MDQSVTCQRVSLDERLRRMRTGGACSAQFADRIAQDFCATPVIPLLDFFNCYPERTLLHSLLLSRREPMDPQQVTFGDLARMIAGDYRRKPGGKRENELLSLLSCFVLSFDMLELYRDDLRKSGRAFTRDALSERLHTLFDFENLCVQDYSGIICRSGMTLSQSAYIRSFLLQHGCSASMKLWQLYNELRHTAMEEKDLKVPCVCDELHTMELAIPFLEMLIVPLAAMQEQHPEQSDAERSRDREGQRTERETAGQREETNDENQRKE